MPYIRGVWTEGSLLEDVEKTISEYGWKKELTFKKAVIALDWFQPRPCPNPSTSAINAYHHQPIAIEVATHAIFKSPYGMYYGLARCAGFSIKRPEIPAELLDAEGPLEGFAPWISKIAKGRERYSQIIMYMAEKLPSIADNDAISIVWDNDLRRAALDIEVIETRVQSLPVSSNGCPAQKEVKIVESDPTVYQSPFTIVNTRVPTLEKVSDKYQIETEFDGKGTVYEANWWPDSQIRYEGWIDSEDGFILVAQADPASAYDKNNVPSFPWYWGKITPFDENDKGTSAMFAGTAINTESENFDYNSTTRLRQQSDLSMMPLKKGYQHYPGNGIDSITVHKTKFGSKYQAHYFSWSADPNSMPPVRDNKGRTYPDAYNQFNTSPFNYQHNPSRYSNKVHSTVPYVMHPEEGPRGYLEKSILMNSLSLRNGTKLRNRIQTCPDLFDVYRFILPTAVSPITKRPGTAYRPAGLGIMMEEGVE
ncbi:hypothetical protein [Bacillus chungangensis]|uniref:Uncharacterized protein n=1 Tax=Bacillus chungangensis TaxID=587633 RepID=A0ABT9WUE0_9BACI|nr:hypothetical protein [Bacillus chungangensis]MDQ0176734.1 hypothetical protein [Bacillus chungangensis]